jgi:flagellar protein FliO/FliZ
MLELAIRLVFSLAVVLGLLLLLAKIAGRRFQGGKDALVQVLHRQQISRGTAVTVVTVAGRVLVLGTTEQQVRVLTELDPEEVADHLPEAALPGEVLTLVPSEEDPTVLVDSAPRELPAPRPAGSHRAAPAPRAARTATPRGGRRAAAPSDSPLSGSVLSADTWRQALAAATRRAS